MNLMNINVFHLLLLGSSLVQPSMPSVEMKCETQCQHHNQEMTQLTAKRLKIIRKTENNAKIQQGCSCQSENTWQDWCQICTRPGAAGCEDAAA